MKQILMLLLCFCTAFHIVAKDFEVKFKQYGLVNISTLDKSIIIYLKYATKDNFLKTNLYGDIRHAYFQPSVAKRIVKAQKLLKAKNKKYSLVIYDAARPLSIQKLMYNKVKGTPNQKYVASPYRGGPHNYGIAVDVTIAYDGKILDMGTPFDSFDELSHITNEQYHVNKKKLSQAAYNNRQLLREIMRSVGFSTIRKEWWHFEGCSKEYMRSNYRLLDF